MNIKLNNANGRDNFHTRQLDYHEYFLSRAIISNKLEQFEDITLC